MQVVNWGILGASKFALEYMAPAIHAARGARLAALATATPSKADPFQSLAPGLKVHGDYDALLADPGVDAVYIPLPNALHIPWAMRAIEAGKHVLVEKPVALQADDFAPLIAARDASGLVVAEAYMIVHHPQWHRVRDLIAEGAIGPLRHVEAVFTYDNRADPGNIRNQAKLGGGALPDIGVYTCGSVRFATGLEPERITQATVAFEQGVDTFAHAVARFPGFTYSGTVSMRLFRHQRVSFHGEDGLIELPCPFNPLAHAAAAVQLTTQKGHTSIETWPGANQYVSQVEAFGDAVRGQRPFPCALEFSRGTQAMIDAIYKAAS